MMEDDDDNPDPNPGRNNFNNNKKNTVREKEYLKIALRRPQHNRPSYY